MSDPHQLLERLAAEFGLWEDSVEDCREHCGHPQAREMAIVQGRKVCELLTKLRIHIGEVERGL